MSRSSVLPFFSLALAAVLVFGCDFGGSSQERESSPSDDGSAVALTLTRSANSNVPSSADSAFVRIWKPNGGYNLKDIVNVPDPGQQTEVSLEVPPGSGYQAGVLVTKPQEGSGSSSDSSRSSSDKDLVAHGSSSQFSLSSGDTARVSLDVNVADLVLEAPSSLQANEKDTVEVIYGVNPPDNDPSIFAERSSNSNFDYFDGTNLKEVSLVRSTDTTTTKDFEVVSSNVQSKDTIYVKVRVFPDFASDWVPVEQGFSSEYFPSEEGGPSFSVPVVPDSSSDSGTVIITFSQDGDGWKKTRHAVGKSN